MTTIEREEARELLTRSGYDITLIAQEDHQDKRVDQGLLINNPGLEEAIWTLEQAEERAGHVKIR